MVVVHASIVAVTRIAVSPDASRMTGLTMAIAAAPALASKPATAAAGALIPLARLGRMWMEATIVHLVLLTIIVAAIARRAKRQMVQVLVLLVMHMMAAAAIAPPRLCLLAVV